MDSVRRQPLHWQMLSGLTLALTGTEEESLAAEHELGAHMAREAILKSSLNSGC